MHADRTLSPSAFPDDTGEASALTRARLAALTAERSPEAYLRAVAALCTDRLLVPVVATATRPGDPNGPAVEKEAEMSVVGLRAADGRRALLAFTGMDSLEAWDARARPVPVTLDTAAEATLADGAEALLLDPAGPDPLVVDGDVLRQLAQGHRLVELGADEFGWAMPADPE